MRPLRPVLSLLSITRLMWKLTNKLNLENAGFLMDFIDYLVVMENKLKDAYSG